MLKIFQNKVISYVSRETAKTQEALNEAWKILPDKTISTFLLFQLRSLEVEI